MVAQHRDGSLQGSIRAMIVCKGERYREVGQVEETDCEAVSKRAICVAQKRRCRMTSVWMISVGLATIIVCAVAAKMVQHVDVESEGHGVGLSCMKCLWAEPPHGCAGAKGKEHFCGQAEDNCLMHCKGLHWSTACAGALRCYEAYCGDQYECGKFQLIRGLPCCDNPEYVHKAGWESWWSEQEYAHSVERTKLPIIVLDTRGQNPSCGDKVDATITVIYDANGSANTITDSVVQTFSGGDTRIKIAGQSSRGYRKKQFNLYLEKHARILDLPKQKHLRLSGTIQDQSGLKNWLIFSLDRCNGQWSPRTRFVRAFLVANDEKGKSRPRDMGLYSLNEKIRRDNHKVNIASSKCSSYPDCGYLMQLDHADQAPPGSLLDKNWCVGAQAEILYPKNPSSSQRDFLQNYINKMCDHAYDDRLFHHIDAESFYNHFVYTQLSMNVDGYISSEYLHKDKGGKIRAGPQWDFDLTFGDNYEAHDIKRMTGRDPTKPEFGWMRDGHNDSEWRKTIGSLAPTFGWSKFLENQRFVNGLICHYKSLRKFNMTDERVMIIIDQGHAFLKLEGASDNFLRDIDGHVAKLKDWTKRRLAWMDAHIDGYKIGRKGNCPDYTPPNNEDWFRQCQMPFAFETFKVPNEGVTEFAY